VAVRTPQRRAEPPSGGHGPRAPKLVHEVLRSPGRPLDAAAKRAMETHLGHDFSSVRVHTDSRAAASADAVGAQAYTVGREIVFGAGEYRPATAAGKQLLRHELVHVAQQPSAPIPAELPVAHASSAGEREAESISAGAALHSLLLHEPRPVLQRVALTRAPTGPPPVPPEQMTRFRDTIAQYRKLADSNQLSAEELAEVERRIRTAEDAIRDAQTEAARGSTSGSIAASAGAATAALAVDDVTGIGVADDVAIPFTAIAALAAGAVWLIVRPSPQQLAQANARAAAAVNDVISAIGQIVLAQQVGKKIRGLTTQIMIHLARILGTAVGGQPPDHQQDPNRDRPHWWTELKEWIKQILDQGLSPKQLLRELGKGFTPEQLAEIREALREAARMMGEDPPDFPPTAVP